MIPRSAPPSYLESWQIALKNTIRNPEVLLESLNLEPSKLPLPVSSEHPFPTRVTKHYLSLIEPGRHDDPLLLQILPVEAEHEVKPNYSSDPLQEANFSPVPGLLHKYKGRVLVIATSACAIHCRYCFRKEFPYNSHRPNPDHWSEILQYIAADSTIEEVIFSGGDPLTLGDQQLEQRIQDLAALDHVQTLRIHSRIPIVLPDRLTPSFTEVLTQTRLKPVLVLHCNHPNELATPQLKAPLQTLQQSGVHLLNQAVLLKGVNDDANTQINLSKKLFSLGVLPYYLHLLDQVSGTQHFHVQKEQALAIHQSLLANLPGYLVPKLVMEQPNESHKTPVIPIGYE